MNEENYQEQPFLRTDLQKSSTNNVAYYRLTKDFKDFLNLILAKHGDVEGIVLTKENGQYHFNIGFIIGKELKKDERNKG